MTSRTNPMTTADAKAFAKTLCEPHFIKDDDFARTPDAVLNSHSLMRFERERAAAMIVSLATALEASHNSRTEAITNEMINVGGSAVIRTAHLTGCERAKIIYTAMQAARPIDQQEAVEAGAAALFSVSDFEGRYAELSEMSKQIYREKAYAVLNAAARSTPIAPVQDESWLAPDEEAELADRINGNWYLQPNDPVQDDDAEWLRDFAAQQPIYRETLERIANRLGNQSA